MNKQNEAKGSIEIIWAAFPERAYLRSGFGHGEYSTRVFGCRPEIVSCITQKSGWINWVNAQAGDTEFRLAEILNNNIPDRILTNHNIKSASNRVNITKQDRLQRVSNNLTKIMGIKLN